jgi:hypothetical protein
LEGINKNWNKYSVSLRNRLLKLLIEKVELRGTYDIDATIFWKTGLQQKVSIHRPSFRSRREWKSIEDTSLIALFPSSPNDIIMSSLANRSWNSITLRAMRLGVKRERKYRPWTQSEDNELECKYISGLPLNQLSQELKRSIDAIQSRASSKGLKRPRNCKSVKAKIKWELHDFIPYQAESSGK